VKYRVKYGRGRYRNIMEDEPEGDAVGTS
jgi:hypothetical protein